MHDFKQNPGEQDRFGLLFFSIFSLFVVLTKIKALSIPFYWDETIYFIRFFYENGFSSLLPGNYIPSHWHGHPPLFQFLHLFIHFFFDNIEVSGHIAALISFLFFLFAVFRSALKSGSFLFSATLIITLYNIPHFFSYSTQLFPNFLMLGAGILAILFYTEDRKLSLGLCLTLCVLTRESGIAFTIPLFLHALFIKKWSLRSLLYIIIPTLLLILFLGYNTYINNSFVSHPYVSSRIENGFELLSTFDKSFESVVSALGHATLTFWRSTFLCSLPILIIGLLYKRQFSKLLKLSHLEIIFTFVCLEFLIFFTLYDDTIPRDFLIITIFFIGAYLKAIDLIAKDPKFKFFAFFIFFIFFFKASRWYHYNYFANDLTQHAYEARAKELRELIRKISNDYCIKTNFKYFAPWPFAESMKIYDTISEDISLSCKEDIHNYDLIINSNLLSSYGEKLFKKHNFRNDRWAQAYSHKTSFNGSEMIYTEVYIRKGMVNGKE